MRFDHPSALALLGLAVPLVALHLYRGRVRRWAVPALRFWEESLREEERRTALRKLRRWASLAVSLAALVLLALALAGPSVPGLTREPRRWAVVLDNGPGMAAREPDGRTRLEHALERAREFLRGRGSGDEAAVFDLGGLRVPWTRDLEAAARAIPVPRVADPADRRAGIRAARAAGTDVTIVFFGDALPGGREAGPEGGRLKFVRVGTPLENSGWVSGVLERRPGERTLELHLAAAAFAEGPVRRTAKLSFEGRILERRDFELRPGGTLEVSWTLDPARYPGAGLEEGGRVRAAWEPADAFPLDDEACFVAPPLAPPGVVVFHGGRPDGFLMKALESMRESGLVREVLHAPIERYASVGDRAGEGWIFVFDRVAPPALPARGGVLVLGAPGERAVERPAVTDWDREAPPNRLVDYAGLLLRKSNVLRGAPPLLSAPEGPLATWSARGGRAVVEAGFAFEDSEPRPALPMMLFNFVEWAAWEGLRSFRPLHRVGEPLRPERPLWTEGGELRFEHGGSERRVAVREGRPEEAPPAEAGFTRIRAGDRWEWTAANLFEAEESDLRGRTGSPEGAPPPPVPWHGRVPFAPVAAAAALALLAVEWVLFQRGRV
jgi:hypothetical protein